MSTPLASQGSPAHNNYGAADRAADSLVGDFSRLLDHAAKQTLTAHALKHLPSSTSPAFEDKLKKLIARLKKLNGGDLSPRENELRVDGCDVRYRIDALCMVENGNPATLKDAFENLQDIFKGKQMWKSLIHTLSLLIRTRSPNSNIKIPKLPNSYKKAMKRFKDQEWRTFLDNNRNLLELRGGVQHGGTGAAAEAWRMAYEAGCGTRLSSDTIRQLKKQSNLDAVHRCFVQGATEFVFIELLNGSTSSKKRSKALQRAEHYFFSVLHCHQPHIHRTGTWEAIDSEAKAFKPRRHEAAVVMGIDLPQVLEAAPAPQTLRRLLSNIRFMITRVWDHKKPRRYVVDALYRAGIIPSLLRGNTADKKLLRRVLVSFESVETTVMKWESDNQPGVPPLDGPGNGAFGRDGAAPGPQSPPHYNPAFGQQPPRQPQQRSPQSPADESPEENPVPFYLLLDNGECKVEEESKSGAAPSEQKDDSEREYFLVEGDDSSPFMFWARNPVDTVPGAHSRPLEDRELGEAGKLISSIRSAMEVNAAGACDVATVQLYRSALLSVGTSMTSISINWIVVEGSKQPHYVDMGRQHGVSEERKQKLITEGMVERTADGRWVVQNLTNYLRVLEEARQGVVLYGSYEENYASALSKAATYTRGYTNTKFPEVHFLPRASDAQTLRVGVVVQDEERHIQGRRQRGKLKHLFMFGVFNVSDSHIPPAGGLIGLEASHLDLEFSLQPRL